MAMIKCPDCKTPISDTAECCPRCGCKFQGEYQEMLRLRQHIYDMEHEQAVRPVVHSVSYGPLLFAVACLGVVIFGVYLLLFRMTGFGSLFLALGCITLGGLLFLAGLASFSEEFDFKKKSEDKVAFFDRTQTERPTRIADAKRRLAQLEAKFR